MQKTTPKAKRRSIFRLPSLFSKHHSIRSSTATSLEVAAHAVRTLDAIKTAIDASEDTGGDRLDEISVDELRSRGEQYANSRWPSNLHWVNPHITNGYDLRTGQMVSEDYPPVEEGWDMSVERAMPDTIRLAVAAAHQVRVRPDDGGTSFTCTLGGGGESAPAEERLPRSRAGMFKPTDIKFVIETAESSGERDWDGTVVIAIRGSRTWMDWLVNFDCEMVDASQLTGERGTLCHSGLLKVKDLMAQRVVDQLKKVMGYPARKPEGKKRPMLLLTGHSAGGAVAGLLWFVFSRIKFLNLAGWEDTIWACFHSIQCITFGAPPFLTPFPDASVKLTMQDPSNHLLSFINEGDPVPRADPAYLKTLLHMYSLPRPPTTSGNLLLLPPMPLQPPGILLGIKAAYTDSEAAAGVGTQFRGVNLTQEILCKTLACNPAAHAMDMYARSVVGYLDQDLPSLSSHEYVTYTERVVSFWPGLDVGGAGEEVGRRPIEEFAQWKGAGDFDSHEVWDVWAWDEAEGRVRSVGTYREERFSGEGAFEGFSGRLRGEVERMGRREEEFGRS
ncbi:hypothetical protein DFH27DRAFT_200229 [Peziza echinospora]|nr:hypothetical protein DFH27DRAFT_200229 [Peziza echinospora]